MKYSIVGYIGIIAVITIYMLASSIPTSVNANTEYLPVEEYVVGEVSPSITKGKPEHPGGEITLIVPIKNKPWYHGKTFTLYLQDYLAKPYMIGGIMVEWIRDGWVKATVNGHIHYIPISSIVRLTEEE